MNSKVSGRWMFCFMLMVAGLGVGVPKVGAAHAHSTACISAALYQFSTGYYSHSQDGIYYRESFYMNASGVWSHSLAIDDQYGVNILIPFKCQYSYPTPVSRQPSWNGVFDVACSWTQI